MRRRSGRSVAPGSERQQARPDAASAPSRSPRGRPLGRSGSARRAARRVARERCGALAHDLVWDERHLVWRLAAQQPDEAGVAHQGPAGGGTSATPRATRRRRRGALGRPSGRIGWDVGHTTVKLAPREPALCAQRAVDRLARREVAALRRDDHGLAIGQHPPGPRRAEEQHLRSPARRRPLATSAPPVESSALQPSVGALPEAPAPDEATTGLSVMGGPAGGVPRRPGVPGCRRERPALPGAHRARA